MGYSDTGIFKHIPGIESAQADQLSREFLDSKELMYFFLVFFYHFFLPNIDLFASRLNTQLYICVMDF